MKKAFFYGDSNTFGYDPAGFMGGRYPRAARWTTILQDNLEGEWEIDADGMPGRSIPTSRYEWEYLRGVIRRRMPFDVFGVMLGTNDLLGTLAPDAAQTVGHMNRLLDFVRKTAIEEAENSLSGSRESAGGYSLSGSPESAGGYSLSGSREKAGALSLPGSLEDAETGGDRTCPQLLLIAPPRILLTDLSYGEPYVSGDRSYAQIYFEEGRRLTQYYRALAASRGIAFADASAWELDFAFDGVHLSEEGHAAFAKHMTEVMKRL